MGAAADATDTRYYVLLPWWSLRGWKLLPYALRHRARRRTEFFYGWEWELIRACDGQTEVRWDELGDGQRACYDRWEREGIIRRCPPGQRLRPEQEYRLYPARFKESVHWSITGRCNFRCRHCFMSAPHAAQGEPSWDQLMAMLDAFERCGIQCLSLTGGEPLIRTDFWELVDEILRRGMIVTSIFTNGLLVTDNFLDGLEARGMRPAILFSFDGVGWHDWMRGVPGAERAVVDAMGRCRERGVPTTATMVICRENVGVLRETVNLLASLGCRLLKVGSATPQGEWLDQPEHYLTQGEAYEAFLEYIPHFFEDGVPISLELEGFFDYSRQRDEFGSFLEKHTDEGSFARVLMCGHVRREMYVSPKGNVLPCMSMVGGPIEEMFPNMLGTPLEEILDSKSLYMDIADLRVSDFMARNPDCAACEWRTQCCGGCRAFAVMDDGTDYLAKDMVACEYYRGGWKDRKDKLLRSLGKL